MSAKDKPRFGKSPGRKPLALSPEAEARIAEGVRRGESDRETHAALRAMGVQICMSTVGTRKAALRGPLRAGRGARQNALSATATAQQRPSASATYASTLPTDPDAIPAGADLSQLDRWIREAESAIEDAKADKNLPLVGTLLRVASTLAETRRKATPPPVADPSDSPDMRALGAEVARRLHEMVDLVSS